MIKTYLHFYHLWLARELTNRANILALFAFRLIQLAITLVVWSYLFRSATTINGYTWDEMLSYFFTIMLTSMIFYPSQMFELQQLVRKGFLNNYLLKPIHFSLFFFSKFLASQTVVVMLCCVLSAVMLSNTHMKMEFSFLVVIYLIMNLLLSFTMGMCISCWAFWIIEMWPFRQIYQGCMVLFGGIIAPLEFLPTLINKIAQLTPFYYQGYGTVLILQGRLTTAEILQYLLMMGCYTCFFYLFYRFLWKKGLRRYEAVNL